VSHRLERLLPVAVVAGMAVLAAVVVLLLDRAADDGRAALEDALVSEVEAVARSQDQRLASTLSSTSGLAQQRYELTEGSAADLAALESLLQLVPDLRTGFFLVDADGTITQGVQLLDPARIGQRYDRPGFQELVARPEFAGRGGILEVDEGITSASPTLALVLPVVDRVTGTVRGAFVFESEVAPDSNLNEEISNLGKGETGRYVFFDHNGVVIAASDPALFDEPITDPELLTGPVGFLEHHLDGDVVVLADVPTAGWRIAFRQDVDEFESGLSGPIQTVGSVVVVAFLAVGAVSGVLLLRRLRAAREEQVRLRRLAESQEEFVSIVSHELRTPVAGVLGFLQTTLDHWDAMDDAARRSAVDRAAANARRLQAMTRDVLDTQSLESGRLVHAIDHVDLARELRDAVEAVRGLDAERELVLQVPDGPVWVAADPDRLQQVLANLIDNARKHSPVVEPIEVGLELADGHAEVRVRDRGAGIPEESIERIFDKFVRGRGESVTGTGLGLYISRQIIDAHGGRIWAESTDGGATFRFVLPVVAPPISGPPPEVVNT